MKVSEADGFFRTSADTQFLGGNLSFVKSFPKSSLVEAGSHLCTLAAAHGHLSILQYLHEEPHACEWQDELFSAAASGGHLHILQYAYDGKCPMDLNNTESCERAAKGGHLPCLQWLRAHNFPWDSKTCSEAAAGAHWETLRWALENGCECDKETCAGAARHSLQMLQWLREEKGCEWDSQTCASAAAAGKLEILQWAREKGCEWDSETSLEAAANGHLEVLRWAVENGCELEGSAAQSAAAQGRIDILSYTFEKDCNYFAPDLWKSAARFGHIEVLKWLHKRLRLDKHDLAELCRVAAEEDQVSVIQWAIDHKGRMPLKIEEIWEAAPEKKDRHAVRKMLEEKFNLKKSSARGAKSEKEGTPSSSKRRKKR